MPANWACPAPPCSRRQYLDASRLLKRAIFYHEDVGRLDNGRYWLLWVVQGRWIWVEGTELAQ
ncbi:MAG: hypothetical protein IPL28_19530 [Chloroflexi bacterium]|nr:hypothetical protein [Chloroflexota bacterium]